MMWFHVNDLLPEECELCHFYSDSFMNLTTVLAMDEDGRMEIKNRLKLGVEDGMKEDEK